MKEKATNMKEKPTRYIFIFFLYFFKNHQLTMLLWWKQIQIQRIQNKISQISLFKKEKSNVQIDRDSHKLKSN